MRSMHRSFWFLAALLTPRVLCFAEARYLLSPAEIPASCQLMPGLFPVGAKTIALYEYREYAVVLPRRVHKEVQSFECNGQRGSLFYFEYPDPAQRDEALLFVRPVLAKQSGLTHELAIQEWEKGFVIASFKEPPEDLLRVLDKKFALPPVSVGVSTVTVSSSPVAASSTAVAAIQPPAPRRPALKKPQPVEKPIAKGAPDLAISVIEHFASKLGCEAASNQTQIKTVCDLLQEFATGFAPELPFKEGVPLIGSTYTVDSFGRMMDLHNNVLMGTNKLDEVGFFAYVSEGGTEDFELKSLIDARKARKDLPQSAALEKIRQLASRKRFKFEMTTGRSLLLMPGGARRVYLRRAGDHLVMVAPAGMIPDEQMRSPLVIAALY